MICTSFRRSVRTIPVVGLPYSCFPPLLIARDFSTTGSGSGYKGNNRGKTTFRTKRRPDPNYRPVLAGSKKVRDPFPGNNHKFVDLGAAVQPKDELDATIGTLAGELVRHLRKERENAHANHLLEDNRADESLRMIDYYLSQRGSIEDLVGERRALAADFDTEEEREIFLRELTRMEEEDRDKDMSVNNMSPTWLDKVEKKASTLTKLYSRFGEDEEDNDGGTDEDKDPDVYLDPNQLAHGDWSEMLIQVDRNVKLWRGGRLESYRALVIGGNLNGCGGFGIGKSTDPIESVNKASRICKRNIFFVSRHQGNGLTRDLAGKQNSCKLVIRATDNGLRGNELVREILKRFGITNAVAKAYGNRSVYNVVHATFKALMTHESLEDISLKRGKRIVSLDRAMRLQI